MKNKIFELIKQTTQVVKDKSIIAAVSGGKDSVFMLHVLEHSKPKKLIVAHFNHQTRPESDSDEEFVKNLAKQKNLDFFSERLRTKPQKGESLEAFYREQRYFFLNKLRQTLGADLICIAHSANDVVETFLFRIITGRLTALPEICSEQLKIFRPLYYWRSDEILKAVKYLDLKFVTDQSNFDLKFDRNFIRQILELISRRFGNKSINNILQKSLELIAQNTTAKQISEALVHSSEYLNFDIKSILRLLPSNYAKRFLINEWFFKNSGFYLGITHLDRLINFLEGEASSIQLPQKITIQKENEKLLFKKTITENRNFL